MSTTVSDLATYLGTAVDPFVTASYTRALTLVDRHIGAALVPQEIVDQAVIEVGAGLYERRSNTSGNSVFSVTDGITTLTTAPVDPLARVYSLLGKWLVPGF